MGSSYRADIDGLRAVAVVAVLLFHLDVPGFSGGYVGVDVFFVISGYLITGFVQSEVAAGQFSLGEFYLRRIRRLAPALLACSVPVAIAAWVLLYPEDMRAFAASLAFQFAAMQNGYFLADGEYFRGSSTKPLLHTWSLAVEEQFYLAWPLLLVVTRRVTAWRRMLIVACLMAGSFLVNVALLAVSPKAAFFLLPARAWELGVGGLVALLQYDGFFSRRYADVSRTASGMVGLVAILVSVAWFTSDTPFPGHAALLPVLGAAMVIVAGVGGTSPVGRVLSHPWMVHVGLISYPLYLWHWPLIAFAHYVHWDPARPLNAIAILVASGGLAEMSYRIVEMPIRRRIWLSSSRSLLVAAGAGAAGLAAFAGHSYFSEGAAYRFTPVARAFLVAPFQARTERCGLLFRFLHPRAHVCAFREDEAAVRRVLLWGNSHADMWSGLLAELASEHGSALYLNARNCRAVTDSRFCGAHVQKAVLQFVSSEHVTDVVLASTWYGAYKRDDALFEGELEDVVGKLSALGVRTWLVTDVPTSRVFDPIDAFERNPAAPRIGTVELSEFLAAKRREEALFAALVKGNRNVRIIDASAGICRGAACSGGDGSSIWYRDAEHLTYSGARTAAREFLPVFIP